MKKFLLIFAIILSFQSFAQGDDITEFEIDGISIEIVVGLYI